MARMNWEKAKANEKVPNYDWIEAIVAGYPPVSDEGCDHSYPHLDGSLPGNMPRPDLNKAATQILKENPSEH